MASLVDYPSSSEEEGLFVPPTKKRKLSPPAKGNDDLPPLPAAFLDQYSSTVRTSAQDDPSLHGGRKRVTPHVQGNWPAHVYLEWHPTVTETNVLTEVVSAVQERRTKDDKAKAKRTHDGERDSNDNGVHSLLETDLGVAQPLHISLSRPLTLKTEQKDAFLSRLQQAINSDTNTKAFSVQPMDLVWHSNETGTRWFLVLRLQTGPHQVLLRLLDACNNTANKYQQPLLYGEKNEYGGTFKNTEAVTGFHVSVAWSLEAPGAKDKSGKKSSKSKRDQLGVPRELLGRVTEMSVAFGEVKVRIGQDVHAVPLKAAIRKA